MFVASMATGALAVWAGLPGGLAEAGDLTSLLARGALLRGGPRAHLTVSAALVVM